MNGLWRGLSFLLEMAFDLWVWVLLLRFVLQKAGTSYYSPVSQILLQLTEWLVKPTRQYLRLRHVWGLDCALLFWLLVFACLEVWVLAELAALMQQMPLTRGWHDLVLPVVLHAVGDLCHHGLNLYFYAILIQAIMSWFSPAAMSPLYPVLAQITDPLLNRVRKFVRPIGGMDLAPMVALILLQLIDVMVFGG